MGLSNLALAVVFLCWILFGARLLQNHVRVRKARGPEDGAARAQDLRAPLSMLGLLLEGVAILVILTWRKPVMEVSNSTALTAIVIALWSVYLASESVRHLGRQWRIKAVVTADHELITTGPYGLIRHPIYLALMGMAFSTALLITQPEGVLLALVIYVIGTEIRVHAEDGILRQRFGAAFDNYARRVKAYVPFVR
jgi:protein-S-isoprenylcysteine O-methyltransferase Ste14